MNDTFFKLRILHEVLTATQKERETLLSELVNSAIDPTIKKRRYRMLSNLATFEASVIKKIYDFETDDLSDLYSSSFFIQELKTLLDRSA
jgi:hypothetical protein